MARDGDQSPKSVARASGVVAVATLASRILGLVRDIVIAGFFGAGIKTDAFFVAFKIPNLLRRLVAEGSLSTAFVPVFTRELSESEEAAKRALATVTTFSFALTSFLAALGIYFAEELTLFFAPGFGAGSVRAELATSLLKLMFPYIILVSLLALAAGVLNTLDKFAVPAIAPAILNVCLIVGVVFFSPFFEEPLFALAWAVLVGGLLGLLPQLVLMKKLGFSLALGPLSLSGPLLHLLKLMIPSVFSASLYQLMVFINTLLASLLAAGSISWLFYADRLFQFPLGVFTLAVGTAILPALSKLSATNNEASYRRQLTLALRWITFITIPASVGLFLLAEEIIEVLLMRGSFNNTDVSQTARALHAYAAGLWAVSTQSILVRAYLSRSNAVVPTAISSLAIIVNIILAFALMGPGSDLPTSTLATLCATFQQQVELFRLGHVGLALSGALAAYLAVFLLITAGERYGVQFSLRELLHSIVTSALLSAVMALMLVSIRTAFDSSLFTLLISLPASVCIYFGLALVLQLPEARETITLLKGRKT